MVWIARDTRTRTGLVPTFITRWSVGLVISEASSLPAVNVPAMATYPARVWGGGGEGRRAGEGAVEQL